MTNVSQSLYSSFMLTARAASSLLLSLSLAFSPVLSKSSARMWALLLEK